MNFHEFFRKHGYGYLLYSSVLRYKRDQLMQFLWQHISIFYQSSYIYCRWLLGIIMHSIEVMGWAMSVCIMLTGIVWHVMSNVSSQTSGRCCIWCDDTGYITNWDSILAVPSIKGLVWRYQCFFLQLINFIKSDWIVLSYVAIYKEIWQSMANMLP